LLPHGHFCSDDYCVDPYGSTESTRVDGTGASALVTWDSKITTVNAILGGVTEWVRQKMKRDGIYEEFISIATVRSRSSNLNELISY
jgi:hypothetical protein